MHGASAGLVSNRRPPVGGRADQSSLLNTSLTSWVCFSPLGSKRHSSRARVTALSKTLRGCASRISTPLTLPSGSIVILALTAPVLIDCWTASRGNSGGTFLTTFGDEAWAAKARVSAPHRTVARRRKVVVGADFIG